LCDYERRIGTGGYGAVKIDKGEIWREEGKKFMRRDKNWLRKLARPPRKKKLAKRRPGSYFFRSWEEIQ
jgi:hypothetical protein